MENEVKNHLKGLGWSDDLIRAISCVSAEVDRSSIGDAVTDFAVINDIGYIDNTEIKVLPADAHTFTSFSIK